MSREIKFRVWDKASNVYLKNTKEPQDDNLFIEEINRKGSGIYEVTNWGDAIIEQFTGLKDKNGIDIYESDIVIVKYCDNGDSYTETVTVTNTNGKGYSPFNWESSCDGCDCNLEINSIEVIGNIHQHSHLLESPK